MSVSTTTSLVLVDTRAASGSIQLPPTVESLGRMITFIDQYKSCSLQSTFTVNTSDSFHPTNQNSYVMNKPGQTVSIIGVVTDPPKWMVIEDDTSRSLTGINLSTVLLSTTTIYASTIQAPAQSQQQTIQF